MAEWFGRGGRILVITLGGPVIAVVVFGLPLWQAALAYAGSAVILWALFGVHTRVVIEGFEDYTTLPGQPTDASGPNGRREAWVRAPTHSGAAVLLANKLAELRELYGFVDDPDKPPAPGRGGGATMQHRTPALGRAPGATVQLDDASSLLRSAVTRESTVSLGPITLPWGALMAAVARLSQVPQLRGAIHGDERALNLTAELARYGQRYSWRVARDVESGTSPRKTLESMIVEELAYQVFSDLTLQRQARWSATKYWLLARGKVAEYQRGSRNGRQLLKDAERYIGHALAEDERFYLAWVDLGIVHGRLALELERPSDGMGSFDKEAAQHGARRYRRAARRVFERAIILRPDRWEAYHALADVHWTPKDTSGSLEMIPGLCDRALDRRPDRAARARIQDLKAHAEERAAGIAREQRHPEADELLRSAVDTRRKACKCALKELRRTRILRADPTESRRLPTLEKQASQCLINLARTAWNARAATAPAERTNLRRNRAAFRWVHTTAKFAAKLSDLDIEGHASLAHMATEAGRPKTAAKELAVATRIAPGNPLYAAKLARTLAPSGGRRALDACANAERLIDFGAKADSDAAKELGAAYEALEKTVEKPSTKAEAIRRRLSLPDLLEAGLEQEYPIAELKGLLKLWPEGRDWERARIQEALGTAISGNDDEKLGSAEQRGRNADRYLKAALEWFENEQPAHRRVTELHAERAEALALVPACSGEALAQAENAITLDPLRARYRDVLAKVYEAGRDLDSAVRAAEDAALLEPDVPRRHYRKAKLRWALAESLADPGAHDAQRRLASEEFEHALRLYESEQRVERRTTSWWLARSYFEMSEFSRVPPHLRLVLGSFRAYAEPAGEQLITAAAEMWLAMTYRKLQDFHAAERHAAKAISAAEAIDSDLAPDPERLKLIFPSEMDDRDWPLGLVLTLAHVERANSRAERGADLSTAWTSLHAAERVHDRMKKMPDLSEACREGESDYQAARGRVLLADDQPDAAIEALRKAADLDPGEADTYLLLARAHVRAIEQEVELGWQTHVRAARDACRRTREIGGDGHPDTLAAAELEQKLRRIEIAAREYRDLETPPRVATDVTDPPPETKPTKAPPLSEVLVKAPAEKAKGRPKGRTQRTRPKKEPTPGGGRKVGPDEPRAT